MRIGVAVADYDGPGALDRVASELRRAAADGFASAWLNLIFGLDSLTALAAVGGQAPGIELGTAVVPTYPRHPIALAQAALTVSQATGGRFTLGIGPSHKMVVEDIFGYRFDQPVRHTREYLQVLRPLLDGQPVAMHGEAISASVGLSVTAPRPVPVLLAALGPRMLRLAGELADGTVLWMTGPATVRDHIVPAITAAARDAGRPSPRVVCLLPVCVTSDVAAARAAAAKVFAIYGELPSYRAMLDREGAAGPADVAVVGDEAAVGKQISALAEAGVTDFIAGEYIRGADAVRTRDFLKSLT